MDCRRANSVDAIDRRRLEQGCNRQVFAERFFDLRDQAHAQQRMTAQIKKVVVNTNSVELEHTSEDFGELLFDRAARRNKRVGELRAELVGRRQCLAIEFAVGSQRQGIQQSKVAWRHVMW